MSDDHKRERILDAATAVFAERDFHRVLVSEVATRAGVGKGTVYLYFPTKDDLHRAALEGSLERLAAQIEQGAASTAPVDRVLADIVCAILRFFWRRPHLLTLVQRYEQRKGRHAIERRVRGRRALGSLLARHRLGGSGAGRDLSVALLLGLARAAILEHGPQDRPEAVAARVVQVFLHGVAGRARRTTAARQRGAA
jgi:AcrR family transcriptional regulator